MLAEQLLPLQTVTRYVVFSVTVGVMLLPEPLTLQEYELPPVGAVKVTVEPLHTVEADAVTEDIDDNETETSYSASS